jgi:hypothetical protein
MPLLLDRLRPRDRAILALFRRHPAVTPEAARQLTGTGHSLNAVAKVLRRLAFRGWLEANRLPGGGGCYVVSRRAAAALGLPKPRRQGLSQSAAIQCLGTLWVCLRQNVDKFSAAEFQKLCPDLLRRGVSATGYGVAADGKLLWLIIDHSAHPRRLAAKVAKAVSKRSFLPTFQELIDAGDFGVLVAVPTAAKAAEVETVLASLQPPIHRNVAVQVVVVPELIPLLLKGN